MIWIIATPQHELAGLPMQGLMSRGAALALSAQHKPPLDAVAPPQLPTRLHDEHVTCALLAASVC